MNNFTFLKDFNTVKPVQKGFELIPASTIAKAIFNIKPGGFGEEGMFTKSDTTGAIYLSTEFTIAEGPYAHRKIFHFIGLKSGNIEADQEDKWGLQGHAMIRRIIESAYNIMPTDDSVVASSKRKIIMPSDLNGLECVIKIGVKQDPTGQYPPKNKLSYVITADQKEYQEAMSNKPEPSNAPGWMR